jgi:calcium-dependent protein kinase
MDTVNFKRTTLTFIASRIPEDQITQLREIFTKFDKNGDGKLSIDELKEGIETVPNCNLEVKDIDKILDVMDSNRNGVIDYTEFIAGCLQSYNYLKENHLKSAFTFFDKDGNGTISKDELRSCLLSEDFTMTEQIVEELLKEADKNNDNQIDYNEFIQMMKSNTEYSKSVLGKREQE